MGPKGPELLDWGGAVDGGATRLCESGGMKVAVIQLAYGDDEPVPERTARVADLVRAQALSMARLRRHSPLRPATPA